MSMLAHPPRVFNTASGVPAWTCQLAQVWRKSCQRKSRSPHRFSALYQAESLARAMGSAPKREHPLGMLADLRADYR